ncbi:hypothetical protein OXX80_000601 [Metschnikowia pulcherrima]
MPGSAELYAESDSPLLRLLGPEFGFEMEAALYALNQPVPIEDQTVFKSESHLAGLAPCGPVYVSNRLFPSAHNFYGPETGIDADIADLIGEELCEVLHRDEYTECMDEYAADTDEIHPDQFFAAFPQTVALGLDHIAPDSIMHDALDNGAGMHDQIYPETADNNNNNDARLRELEDLIFTLGMEYVTSSDDSPDQEMHEDYSGLSGSYLIQDNDTEATEQALFALLDTRGVPLNNSSRFEAEFECEDPVAERQNREFKKYVNRARAA